MGQTKSTPSWNLETLFHLFWVATVYICSKHQTCFKRLQHPIHQATVLWEQMSGTTADLFLTGGCGPGKCCGSWNRKHPEHLTKFIGSNPSSQAYSVSVSKKSCASHLAKKNIKHWTGNTRKAQAAANQIQISAHSGLAGSFPSRHQSSTPTWWPWAKTQGSHPNHSGFKRTRHAVHKNNAVGGSSKPFQTKPCHFFPNLRHICLWFEHFITQNS